MRTRLGLGRWILAICGWVPRNRRQRRAAERRRSLVRYSRFDTLEQRVVLNADPMAVDDEYSVDYGTPLNTADYAPNLGNDTDADSDKLGLRFHAGPATTVSLDSGDTYSWNYVVGDDHSGVALGQVRLNASGSTSASNSPTVYVEQTAAGEQQGSVTVNVRLTHASNQTITVDWQTSTGNAVEGSDYSSANWHDGYYADEQVWRESGYTTYDSYNYHDTSGYVTQSVYHPEGRWVTQDVLHDGYWNWENVWHPETTTMEPVFHSAYWNWENVWYPEYTTIDQVTHPAYSQYEWVTHPAYTAIEPVYHPEYFDEEDQTTHPAYTADEEVYHPETTTYDLVDYPEYTAMESVSHPGYWNWENVWHPDAYVTEPVTHPGYSNWENVWHDAYYAPGQVWESSYYADEQVWQQSGYWGYDPVWHDTSGYVTEPVWHTGAYTNFGTLTFLAGETAKQLTFNVIADGDDEGDEAFNLTLNNASGAYIQSWSSGQVTILDDDHNLAPVAHAEGYEIAEDGSLVVTTPDGVLRRSLDFQGESISAVLQQGPQNGSLTLNTDGSFTYTPNANFFGVDTFTYNAQDASGQSSSPTTVTITVSPVNDIPTFTAGSSEITVTEDSGDFLAGWATQIAAGPENESEQTLTWTVTTDHPELFAVQPSVDAEGRLAFRPALNAAGTATLQITLVDQLGEPDSQSSPTSTVTVTITPVQDAPVALANEFSVTPSGIRPISKAALLTGDTDPDAGETATLMITSTSAYTQQGVAVLFDANDNTFYYRAPNGFIGDDTFSYTISDGHGGSSTALATIHVAASGSANAAPVIVTTTMRQPSLPTIAQGISSAANHGMAVVDLVTQYRDILNDPNGTLPGIQITNAPGGLGTWQYSLNGGTSWTTIGTRVVLGTEAGTRIRYQPNATTYSRSAITFRLWDQTDGYVSGSTGSTANGGGTSAYSINTIQALQDISATPGSVHLDDQYEDVAIVDNVGTLISSLTASAPGGSAYGIAITGAKLPNGFGAWQYRLTDESSWTSLTDLTNSLNQNEIIGIASSDPATFQLNVVGYGSVYCDTADVYGTNVRLQTLLGTYGANMQEYSGYFQIEFGGVLANLNVTWSITNVETPGSFSYQTTVEGQSAWNPALVLRANSETRIRYSTAVADYSGDTRDALYIGWWDGTDGAANGDVVQYPSNTAISSPSQPVSLRILPSNDAPLSSISVSTIEDTPTEIFGRDIDGDLLTYEIVSAPTHGTVTVEYGRLLYKPEANYFGPVNFQVLVSDGIAAPVTANVGVTVAAKNDAPTFQSGANTVTVSEDSGVYSAPWAVGMSKGPTNESSQTLSWSVSNNNTSLFSVQPTFSADGRLTFTPAANRNGAATVTVALLDNGGTTNGGINTSGTRTFVIQVDAVNDAPSLTNGATVSWGNTNEETPSPTTTVANLLSAAGWADVDTSAAKGIAVTGTAGNGTWRYSTDGTTWNDFISVSATSALLLTATTQVRFAPDGFNGGSATFDFRAWDQSTGTASTNSARGYADIGTTGGSSAFSTQSATASLTVTSLNDAPTLTAEAIVVLNGTDEDTPSTGTTVATILAASGWSDVDNSALAGIAITATSYAGSWQYSTDGTNWSSFRYYDVSETNALLLSATTQIRYVPDSNNSGTATFSFRAWDQTTGTPSTLNTRSYGNVATNGGTTSYSSQSATASLAVANVNDPPTIFNWGIALPGTGKDTASSESSVAALLATVAWHDNDASPVSGIAVTSTTGSGIWQYSTDGSWHDFGGVSTTEALLLSSATQLRYVPDGAHSEITTLTFRAWDQTTGTASTSSTREHGVPGAGGGSSAYSAAAATASILVNDAPTLANDVTITLMGTDENTSAPPVTVAGLLAEAGWGDVNVNAAQGIAVTGTTGNGHWQYSTDGETWSNFVGTSSTNALLLSATTQIRYAPDAVRGETATLTFRAWDQTAGTPSTNSIPSYGNTSSTGGTTSYSTQAASIVMAVTDVNDAPTLNTNVVVTLTITDEDTASTGTTVASLLSNAGWNDVDAVALSGIAVTSATGNGAWQYSTNGTAWVDFDDVSAAAALLLSSTTQVRYAPDKSHGETATFGFRAWDQTSGTATTQTTRSYGNAGINGGPASFSAQSAVASIVITDVNDAPTFDLYGDVAVAMNDGPQTRDNFLTNLIAGPDGADGPTYTITLTSDNPDLFTTGGQPTLEMTDGIGKLKFTPQFAGSALITVKSEDKGETRTKTFWIDVTEPLFGSGGGGDGSTDPGQTTVPVVQADGNWLQDVTVTTSRGVFKLSDDHIPEMDAGDDVSLEITIKESDLANRQIKVIWGDPIGGSVTDQATLNGSPVTLSHNFGDPDSYQFYRSTQATLEYLENNQVVGRFVIPLSVHYEAPTLTVAAPGTVAEGGTLTLTGTWTSLPELANRVAVSIVPYEDGSVVTSGGAIGAGTYSLALTFADDGAYYVTVQISDGFTTVKRTVAVTVTDVSPTVTWNFNEGQTLNIDPSRDFVLIVPGAAVSDPGLRDHYRFTVEWSDGELFDSDRNHDYRNYRYTDTNSDDVSATVHVYDVDGTEIAHRSFNVHGRLMGPELSYGSVVSASVEDFEAAESVQLADGRTVKNMATVRFTRSYNHVDHSEHYGSATVHYYIVRNGAGDSDLAAAATDAQADWVTSTSGTITFSAGELLKELSLEAKTDTALEFDELYDVWFQVDGEDGAGSLLYNGNALLGTPGEDIGYVLVSNSPIWMYDKPSDVTFGSNNVDTASTGLTRATASDGNVNIDLYDGRKSWNAPFGSGLATFYLGYHDTRIDVMKVPDLQNVAFFQTSTAGTDYAMHDLRAIADVGDDAKIVTFESDRSVNYIYFTGSDFSGIGTRTIKNFANGIGDLAFYDLTEIDPNPIVHAGDANWRAGYVDRLIPVGYDGIDFGFLLLRHDGTSAWYKAAPQNGTTVPPTIVHDAFWQAADDRGIRRAVGTGATERVEWTFDGLDPNRMYQVFAPIPETREDIEEIEGIFGISWTSGYSTDTGTRFAGTGVSGLDVDNATQYSLGWFRPDSSGKIVLSQNAASSLSDLTIVDDWDFKTPDGSLAKLETVSRAYGSNMPQFRLTTNDGVQFDFDGLGLMLSEQDVFGNREEYAYTGTEDDGRFARLSTITDQGGRVTTLNYATAGSAELFSVTDPQNRTTSFFNGLVISATPETDGDLSNDQSLRMMTYVGGRFIDPTATTKVVNVVPADIMSLVDQIRWSDALLAPTGQIGRFEAGLPEGVHEAHASVTRAYDSTQESLPEATTYQFDRFGLTTAIAAPAVDGQASGRGDVWKWVRSDDGKIKQAYSPAGRGDTTGITVTLPPDELEKVEYDYDSRGHLKEIKYADNTKKEWVWSDFPEWGYQIKSYTDRTGRKTTYEYELDDDDRFVKIEHVDPSDEDEEHEGLDLTTKYVYTAAPSSIGKLAGGLLEAVITTVSKADDGEGAVRNLVRYQYYGDTDGAGRVGQVKAKFYSRADDQDDPEGEEISETFDYDAYGNLVEKVDVNGVRTVYRHDRLGQLLEERLGGTRAPNGALTGGVLIGKYTYDAAGNLRSETRPTPSGEAGYTTVLEYDSWNRLIKRTDPSASGQHAAPTTEITYTADGLVLTSTDAAGHSTTYEYDARRRQTKVTEAGATTGVVRRSGGTAFTGNTETSFAYDAADQLKNTTDALNRTTLYAYDAYGRLAQSTSADPDGDGEGNALTGLVVRTEYDASGRKTHEYAPNPEGEGEVVTSYYYDAAGRLIRVQQPKVHVEVAEGVEYDFYSFTAYEYYDNGQLKAERIGLAHIGDDDSAWDLAADGTMATGDSAKKDDIWSASSTTYDFLGRVIGTETTYAGATSGPVRTMTSYKLEAGALVVSYTGAAQYAAVKSALNGDSNADVSAYQTITKYDALGRVASIQSPDPDKTSSGDGALVAPLTKYDYFEDGRLKRTVQTYVGGDADPKNLVTTYTYDELGRTRVETIDGVATTTTYDKLGHVKKTFGSDGSLTSNEYNELGELTETETTDAGKRLTKAEYKYDQVGMVYRTIVDGQKETDFQYDALDRQTESRVTYRMPDGSLDHIEPAVHTHYAQSGLVGSTDDGSLTTTLTYDALGRTLTTVETQSAGQSQSPTTRTTANVYDDAHRKSSLIDPNGNKTTTTVDGLGREAATSISSGGSTSRTYDAAGNLIAYTDRRGYQFTYEYDALNRRTKEVWVGGNYEIAYAYDNEGLRAQVTAGGVTYAYQYAADGSVTRQSVTIAGLSAPVTLDYVYDKFHRLTSRSDNLGGSQVYGYDAAGRLDNSSLILGSQAYVVTRHYNDQNLVDQIDRRATGETTFLRSTYLYNGAKRFTDITFDVRSGASSLSTPLVLHYGYDAKGRLDSSNGPEGSRTYQYDDLDQLTKVLSDGNTLNSYKYDAGGNHDEVDGADYVVFDNNELESDTRYGYTYDPQSNRTYRTNLADGTWEQYAYDRRNRLTSVEFHDASTAITQRIKYEYDASDHRVARYLYDGSEALVGEEHYIYDGDTLLFVLDGAGDVQTRLFNVGSQAVGQQRAGADFEWILTDQLGSTRALVAAAGGGVGQVTAAYDYDAYGNLSASSSDPTLSVKLYAGYRYEALTGYYEAWHRWYDPKTGRWISQDPIGFEGGTTNLNEYVGNNPLNKIDPTGLKDNQLILTDQVFEFTDDEKKARGLPLQQRITYIPLSFRDNPNTFYPDNLLVNDVPVGRYVPEYGFVEWQYSQVDKSGRQTLWYRTSMAKLASEVAVDRWADRSTGSYWQDWFKENNDKSLASNSEVLSRIYIGYYDPGFNDRVHGFENSATVLANINYIYMSASAGMANPSVNGRAVLGVVGTAQRAARSEAELTKIYKANATRDATSVMAAQRAKRPVELVITTRPPELVNMARKEDIKAIDKIVREVRLTPGQRRLLHDEITKQEFSIDDIREIAKQIKELYPKK